MEGRSLIGPRQRTCRGLAEPRPRPRRAPRRPLAARSHAETIDDTDTEPATALSTRRSVLLGAGALPCGCCGAAAPARASSSSPRRRGFLTAQYDRYMSAALSQDAMAGYERSVAPMKRRLFGGLAGSPNEGLTIVELGVGAAPNARYYCDARRGKNDTIVGVDKNPEVLRRAGAELESRGVDGDRLRLVEADVSSTGLPSGYADAVVGTLLLCSVRDQSEALAEIRRILKPGGKYYFVEHVAAPKGTTLRVAQDILNPLQVRQTHTLSSCLSLCPPPSLCLSLSLSPLSVSLLTPGDSFDRIAAFVAAGGGGGLQPEPGHCGRHRRRLRGRGRHLVQVRRPARRDPLRQWVLSQE